MSPDGGESLMTFGYQNSDSVDKLRHQMRRKNARPFKHAFSKN